MLVLGLFDDIIGVLFHSDAYQVTGIDKKVSPNKVVDTNCWFRLEMESNTS
jgi:hypothetical protein